MSFYSKIVRPALFSLPPETAHEIGINALRLGLGAGFRRNHDAHLIAKDSFGEIDQFGLKFANPLGIAAGFDKNGVVVNQLASLGFGFVEVGTVTSEPQPGNPKPRMFRLPADGALINRLGFNNEGAATVVERLKKVERKCVIGVNIGKNKDVPNERAIENYGAAFEAVWEVADYVAINVSSPNTVGLRELQGEQYLSELLIHLQQRNSVHAVVSGRFDGEDRDQEISSSHGKPILVKIAPDLDDAELEIIVDTCLRFQIAGIIATNTTISRDGVKTAGVSKLGDGGLSGLPIRDRSTEVISSIYKYSNGKIPVVGVGGIFTAEDAFEKIAAGACLLQAYTGFIYRGPSFAGEINDGLARILKEKGFNSLDEAIGSNSRH